MPGTVRDALSPATGAGKVFSRAPRQVSDGRGLGKRGAASTRAAAGGRAAQHIQIALQITMNK